MKIFINILLLLFPFLFSGVGNSIICNNKEFFNNEEFVYEVSYGPLKIGQIRMKIIDIVENNDGEQFVAKAYIDSYSWVPFVDLHHIMETYVNKNLYANHFKYYEKEENKTKYTEYKINYNYKTLRVIKGYVKGEVLVDTTYIIKDKLQDGLSLYYFARAYSGSNTQKSVNCFIIEKFGTADIHFTQIKKYIELGTSTQVKCNYLYGKANFIGIFGLTGDFNGWFTDDIYGLPIEASLKVILGSVNVKLKSWNNKYWNPK
ncbi:MAG TPA: DUF3108 domain-containing protein [Ignavibacteriales bacterium]|nr:DUF3108 domain-containing protein [Ignavibacteriales bacterium]